MGFGRRTVDLECASVKTTHHDRTGCTRVLPPCEEPSEVACKIQAILREAAVPTLFLSISDTPLPIDELIDYALRVIIHVRARMSQFGLLACTTIPTG